jgi:glycosyltransferase involved in cell wall biosynthesis
MKARVNTEGQPIADSLDLRLQPISSPKRSKISITHIINGLHTGGAEMMLYKLLCQINRQRFEPSVITLIGGDNLKTRVEKLGIQVYSLGMTRGVPSLKAVVRLAKLLRQHPPDIVQTWMYHSDLLGGVVSKLFTPAPVVWNIQASNIVSHPDNKVTWLTIKLCSLLSSLVPSQIISCSEVACQIHTLAGYDAKKLLPIPNGVELVNFRPDESARVSFRKELGLAPATPLIGMVARFHPQKDHCNFIQAARFLHAMMPDVHYVLCGGDITSENSQLITWIEEAGIRSHCHLLGLREDIPRINAAMDVATLSSSFGEGFPNVLGEAMACGVPCVTTDVGDSALIVGETGVVVPPQDPTALAEGWQQLLNMTEVEKKRLSQAVRQRVEERFSLPSIVTRYEKLYCDLLGIA